MPRRHEPLERPGPWSIRMDGTESIEETTTRPTSVGNTTTPFVASCVEPSKDPEFLTVRGVRCTRAVGALFFCKRWYSCQQYARIEWFPLIDCRSSGVILIRPSAPRNYRNSLGTCGVAVSIAHRSFLPDHFIFYLSNHFLMNVRVILWSFRAPVRHDPTCTLRLCKNRSQYMDKMVYGRKKRLSG